MSFQSSSYYYSSVKNVQIYEYLDKTVGPVKIECLDNGDTRIKNCVAQFKNNNKEYLKIEKTVEEEVSRILRDGKVFLQFPLPSVIGSLKN